MKYLMFIPLLILMSMPLSAQNINSENKDVLLLILNKKGHTIDRIVTQTINDSVSIILPDFGKATIPVTGLDSIVVTLRSTSQFSYLNDKGKSITVKKKGVNSGSLSDVPALLQQKPYRSLIDLLQGQVAGLNVTSSGANIRGQNTLFNGDSEPLVVLDGVAIGTINQASSTVNINDIQSIEVLKDGAGWGVRGANGVILIKTRKR